jgi:hypothetical protein
MSKRPTYQIAPKDMPTYVASSYAVRLDEHPLYGLMLAVMDRDPENKKKGTREMLQLIYALMLSSAYVDRIGWRPFDRHIEELLEHQLQLNGGSGWTWFRRAADKLIADAERHLALARERRGRSAPRSVLDGEIIYPNDK